MTVAQALVNERIKGPNPAVPGTRSNGTPSEKFLPGVEGKGLVIASRNSFFAKAALLVGGLMIMAGCAAVNRANISGKENDKVRDMETGIVYNYNEQVVSGAPVCDEFKNTPPGKKDDMTVWLSPGGVVVGIDRPGIQRSTLCRKNRNDPDRELKTLQDCVQQYKNDGSLGAPDCLPAEQRQ